MTILATDIKFRKSALVSDSINNGGRKGYPEVVSGARHSLFPRVTKTERTAGVIRYRKEFLSNEDSGNETAYGVEVCLEIPSTGGDNFQLCSGSQTNIQSDLSLSTRPSFYGTGQLQADITDASTSIPITMESNTIEFPNGKNLHISDKYAISQTIDTDVNIGDSVELISGTWEKSNSSDDITYPLGLYLGNNIVMTVQDSTNEEWLELADNLTTAEVIGTGNDTANPNLTTLANKTNGICKQTDKRPTVVAISGGNPLLVTIDRDGLCSGDCTAGQLNMTTGVWTTKIVWTDEIDNATNITCTYRENCFSYSGNVATVELSGNPANSYDKDNTFAGGCISMGDVKTSFDAWDETSSAGTFDESNMPLILSNKGTVEDTFTITFATATTFACSGAAEGSLGTGAIGADFSPININTGFPYFTIDKDGWGGTWAIGETIVFKTHPSAMGIWLKETVPALTAAVANNLCVLGFYAE